MSKPEKPTNGRSILVDPMAMRRIRLGLGLTQAEAGRCSGYGERLIRKIETDGKASRQSLADLIQAYNELSSDQTAYKLDEITLTFSRTEQERIVREWFQRVFNERDLTMIDELMASNVVLHAEGETRVGREVIHSRVSGLLAAFNPLQITVDKVLADGDYTVSYWTVVKTHVGEFLGIPPTGRTVTIRGSSMVRFQDRQIVEALDHWDVQDLILQLNGGGSQAV